MHSLKCSSHLKHIVWWSHDNYTTTQEAGLSKLVGFNSSSANLLWPYSKMVGLLVRHGPSFNALPEETQRSDYEVVRHPTWFYDNFGEKPYKGSSQKVLWNLHFNEIQPTTSLINKIPNTCVSSWLNLTGMSHFWRGQCPLKSTYAIVFYNRKKNFLSVRPRHATIMTCFS